MRITKVIDYGDKAKLLKWFLLLCLFAFLPSKAQIGTWRAYMSYYEPQQIVKASNSLFVRASNDLYQYNLTDHSITTYDKITGLNDSYITHIAWNQEAKQLIIVYKNTNIDLLSLEGEVFNISSLYTKSMTQDKTINNIYINGVYAYLCTGFGLVKINMQRGEISESYILDKNIVAVGISGTDIYIKSDKGTVLTGKTTTNLIDPHNWTSTTSYPTDIFTADNSDWNEYHELVATLDPGGPKYNYFSFMTFKHNRLYTCGGGYVPVIATELNRPGTVQVLNNNEWTIMQDNLKELTGWDYVDVECVEPDPNDPMHIFAGGRTGLYEFQDGNFVTAHNLDNSPLQTATTSNTYAYVLIEGMCYDNDGSLWCFNSSTRKKGNLFEYTKDKQWIDHSKEELVNGSKSIKGMRYPFQDSRGYIWFINCHFEVPSFYCYDPVKDEIIHSFKSLTNQDGSITSDYRCYSITEDLEGNIWVGTSVGPFMIESANVGVDDSYVTQVKVPRNDGTNYADYLLAGANIHNIVIDGGGRKWFGTQGSGIYLISADNMTELAHFTAENSPLLSNNIESLAINNETGELFIGTDVGLCSYITDATAASIEMVKDNVYAYPNPVVSGYDGLITIVGLSLDADIKIMSTSGQLVAEGRSNGGTFTWNGKDRSGKRVASGVYMVAAATSDGKKGTVCKIAIIK